MVIPSKWLDGVELAFSQRTEQETDHRQDNKDEKQDFGNAHGTGGYTAKPEQGRNQGDDKKDNGVIQHGVLLKSLTV
jgi:hypothetical protein